MTDFTARIDGNGYSPPTRVLCDAWLVDNQRFGDGRADLGSSAVIGHWPGELELDAVVRLAQTVGEDPTWEVLAAMPPVAQKLAERAQPQPLDLAIARHLQHLQHVCHQPRLNLRVEEERLPVSRARRTPVRAVVDLVSHPGDWEHRTLRSIQPSRVLARQIEDEWNLYENRVAVRLVDHLLAYLAKRLEELRKIKEILDASRDHSDEIRRTSFRRARRIAELWSNTLESKTEDKLKRTMKRLELAQRDLQNLLGAPLYQQVPRRQLVALSLKPTNILVNDPHYRKVAALWRLWSSFGHKKQETAQQRTARWQREATAWDRFVFHLVVRGFASLGWSVTSAQEKVWDLAKSGWLSVQASVNNCGLVLVTAGDQELRFLPLCADISGANQSHVLEQVTALDKANCEVVIAHVGATALLADIDRASGWSIGGRAVLFACSPWGIDSEERMARVLHGWLCRVAVPVYPVTAPIRGLPKWSQRLSWLQYDGNSVVALRSPTDSELSSMKIWASEEAKELDAKSQRAKVAKQEFDVAPREAISAFQSFILNTHKHLDGLDICPICNSRGHVELRGEKQDGSDATWWACCYGCGSKWGTRPCTNCGNRYRTLIPEIGFDPAIVAINMLTYDWPDKVFGRDVWAQPCAERPKEWFRCPQCGRCPSNTCRRCHLAK